MRLKIKRSMAILFILALSVQFSLQMSFADETDIGYTTKSFDVNVEITEDYVFHFTETIQVNFEDEKHGIYRYIPQDDRLYSIENVDVEEWYYDTFNEDDFTIKIGEPDLFVNGEQTYKLSYDIVGFKDRDSQGDEINLDVLPTGWETPIEEANIIVHFPKPFDLSQFKMFFGSYGSSGDNGKIKYSFSDDGLTCTISATHLGKGEGITIAADLPEGYWVQPQNYDWLMHTTLALLIGGIIFGAINWFKYGRDEKVVKTVEFYPPDSLTPAEVAYVANSACCDNDLSAMFLYFADKGYLTIEENGTGQFSFKKMVKKPPQDEPLFARILFNGLFKSTDKVSLSELPDGMSKRYEKATAQLERRFEKEEKRLFTSKSQNRQMMLAFYHMAIGILPCLLGMIVGVEVFSFSIFLLLVLAGSAFYGLSVFMSIFDQWNTSKTSDRLIHIGLIVVILGFNYWMNCKVFYANFHSVAFCVAFVVLSLILAFFAAIMQSRTSASNQLLGRVLGFRDFIETAELDRLKILSKENPEYFYHIMPYAFVLGLSDKWTERFVGQIPLTEPSWYSGNCANPEDLFWYNYLASRCLNSITRDVDSKIFDENEGDSSGGSGGGLFSGGGFGGGGGGSW